MNLNYISDSTGKHTAVIVPISEWNTIMTEYQSLKQVTKMPQKKKPSDFVGCISKETAAQMIFDIEQSRNEWDRI